MLRVCRLAGIQLLLQKLLAKDIIISAKQEIPVLKTGPSEVT